MFQLLRTLREGCLCHGCQGIWPGWLGSPMPVPGSLVSLASRLGTKITLKCPPWGFRISCCRFRIDACSDGCGQSRRPLVVPREAQPSLAHQQYDPASLVLPGFSRSGPWDPPYTALVWRACRAFRAGSGHSGINQRLLARPVSSHTKCIPCTPTPYPSARTQQRLSRSYPILRMHLFPVCTTFSYEKP